VSAVQQLVFKLQWQGLSLDSSGSGLDSEFIYDNDDRLHEYINSNLAIIGTKVFQYVIQRSIVIDHKERAEVMSWL
jgi:hypothetical protein